MRRFLRVGLNSLASSSKAGTGMSFRSPNTATTEVGQRRGDALLIFELSEQGLSLLEEHLRRVESPWNRRSNRRHQASTLVFGLAEAGSEKRAPSSHRRPSLRYPRVPEPP